MIRLKIKKCPETEASNFLQNCVNGYTGSLADPSEDNEVDIMAQRERDVLKTLGNILLTLGVGVWGAYAVLRYGMGWELTARQCLPYHLAGVVPGMILRRHQFFRRIVGRLFS